MKKEGRLFGRPFFFLQGTKKAAMKPLSNSAIGLTSR